MTRIYRGQLRRSISFASAPVNAAPVQRTYCDLLAQEQGAAPRKNGLHAA